MAKDVVWGMEVDEKEAAAISTHGGKTYYFCAPGCQTQPPRPGAPRPTALDIAGERYARGDITREEFEQIKRDPVGS